MATILRSAVIAPEKRKLALRQVFACVLLFGMGAVHAATPSLCEAGESTYFSCKLKSSKVVSICGSGQVSPRDKDGHRAAWLQYRMGRPGALELVFPKQRAGSVAKFTGESTRGAGVRIDALEFAIGGIRYTVEDSYSSLIDKGFAGVKVVVGRKETALACDGDANVDGEFGMLSQELDPGPQ
jgi:hypothetical protein